MAERRRVPITIKLRMLIGRLLVEFGSLLDLVRSFEAYWMTWNTTPEPFEK